MEVILGRHTSHFQSVSSRTEDGGTEDGGTGSRGWGGGGRGGMTKLSKKYFKSYYIKKKTKNETLRAENWIKK